MHKIILLVLTDEHAKYLPQAAASLKALSPESVWLIHSPHIGVTDEKVIEEIDIEIARWEKSMDEASARRDFGAAKEMKEGWEKARMNRDKALKSGWTSVTPAKREECYFSVFDKFIRDAGCPFNITTLSQAPEPNSVFHVLASLSAVWPKTFEQGTYFVTWPSSLAKLAHESVKTVPTPAQAAPKPVEKPVPVSRREQLKAMRMLGVRTRAIKLGVWQDRMNLKQAVDAVLAAESAYRSVDSVLAAESRPAVQAAA